MREEAMAYVDDGLVPAEEASVPITDPGFTWGYNVYDVFRTVNGEPYEMETHVDRLFRSCRAAQIQLERSPADVRAVCQDVVAANQSITNEIGDLMVIINVSGGWSLYPDGDSTATLTVTASPIPFAKNAWKFIDGAHLVTPSTRQGSPATLSPQIKHRSRMHFVIADREAKQVDPQAEPLLLDGEGNVTEVFHANVFIVNGETVKTPPVDKVLPGVARDITIELSRDEGFPVKEQSLQRYDVANADEVFYTNTSHLVTPVTKVNGQAIGSGRPGPVTETLIEAHGERAGIDLVGQFLRHLPEKERPNQLQLGGDRGVS